MTWTDKINQVWQGDCLELMKEMPDGSVDMILSDLPYLTIEKNWDKKFDYTALFSEFRRVIKLEGCMAIMLSYPKAIEVISEQKDIFKYDMVWIKPNKTNFANAKNKPLRQHENIFIFSLANTANGSKNKMNYFPQGLERVDKKMRHNSNRKTPSFMGIRNSYQGNEYIQEFTNYPSTIFKTEKKEIGLHPTQKPLELFDYLIRTFTKVGDLVMDGCMGSWTTARACMDLGRNFIGAELSEEYCQIGRNRLKQQVLL